MIHLFILKMRLLLLTAAVLIFWSCKKNPSNNTDSPPPTSLPDSTFSVIAVMKTDINEYNLQYQVKPGQGNTYNDIHLVWSTSPSFDFGKDSVLLFNNTSSEVKGAHSLTGLKQGAAYYAKISLRYKKEYYTSAVKEWNVDSLKFTMIFYSGLFPVIAPRGGNVHLRTNSGADTTKTYSVGTKVMIGSYDCPVTIDKGSAIYFDIPTQIPPGNYSLKLERKGITISTPDSILVLRGFWSDLSIPQILVNGVSDPKNTLGDYGSTYSSTKAYIVGGSKLRPAGNSTFFNELSKEIYEYDVASNIWQTKPIINPISWERPNTFYYNNSIYVIGGMMQTVNAFYNPRQTVRNVWQIDINTMKLSIADTVAYSARYNPVSFQINDEWYIGMGLDSANKSICCGNPLPAQDFWKYNPSSKQWTRIADFPGTYQTYPATFTIGSKGYVFISDIAPPNQELWEYSSDLNSWKKITIPVNNHLILRGEKYSVVSYNQKIYLFTSQTSFLSPGGYGTTLDYIFIEFDPATGQLKKINPNTNLGLLKPIYQNGNKVIFRSDVLGSIQALPYPNTTNLILD